MDADPLGECNKKYLDERSAMYGIYGEDHTKILLTKSQYDTNEGHAKYLPELGFLVEGDVEDNRMLRWRKKISRVATNTDKQKKIFQLKMFLLCVILNKKRKSKGLTATKDEPNTQVYDTTKMYKSKKQEKSACSETSQLGFVSNPENSRYISIQQVIITWVNNYQKSNAKTLFQMKYLMDVVIFSSYLKGDMSSVINSLSNAVMNHSYKEKGHIVFSSFDSNIMKIQMNLRTYLSITGVKDCKYSPSISSILENYSESSRINHYHFFFYNRSEVYNQK